MATLGKRIKARLTDYDVTSWDNGTPVNIWILDELYTNTGQHNGQTNTNDLVQRIPGFANLATTIICSNECGAILEGFGFQGCLYPSKLGLAVGDKRRLWISNHSYYAFTVVVQSSRGDTGFSGGWGDTNSTAGISGGFFGLNNMSASTLPAYNYTSDLPDQAGGVVVFAGTLSSTAETRFNYSTNLLDVTQRTYWRMFYEDIDSTDPDDDDPYEPIGDSETGGGGGTFDFDIGDYITPPEPPIIPTINNGFMTMYKVTPAEVSALGAYLWNMNIFDIGQFQKLFQNPMEAIINLSLCAVTPSTASTIDYIKVGNISTTVGGVRVTNQYVEFDLGSINMAERFGGYIDYNPFTKCEIYMPYVGVRQLDIDEVMARTLNLKYNIDVFSGSCVACVYTTDTQQGVRKSNGLLYQFEGNVNMQIPISANDCTALTSALLNVSAQGLHSISGGLNAAGAEGLAMSAVNTMLSSKLHIQKSGTLTGTNGLMSKNKAYIIIHTPRACIPTNQNLFQGYPTYITVKLSECIGFTVVNDIELNGIDLTDGELNELKALLKGGVIL